MNCNRIKYVKISDFAEVVTGGTPTTNQKEYWDNGNIPWIASGECKNAYIYNATKYITELGYQNSSTKIMPIDTVVIALTGATTGLVGLLGIEACGNQSVTGILPNDKFISKYLFYYLISIRDKVLYDSYGGAQKHISQKYVKEIEVLLPPLKTQKKIVEALDKAQGLIDARKEQIRLMDELVQSRFVEMFGDQATNQNDYSVILFNDVIEYMGDIGSNGANAVVSAHLNMKQEPDYALMVRFLNFTANDFETNVKYVSEETYKFFKKSQVFGGELIFCKIGSAGLNYVMPHLNKPVSLGLNQIMVRTKNNINMTYLHTLLNTNFGKHLIEGCINGAVTKSITKGALKKIPIMFPPIDRQNQFADYVQKVGTIKLKMQTNLKELITTQQALIQQYFG